MHIRHNYTHGGDIYLNRVRLDFSANVNPLGTPREVQEAVCKAAANLAAYPDPYCGPLRQKLAEVWSCEPENILCGNGAAELIFQFVLALHPKKALLPVPSFSEYAAALQALSCTPELYFLDRNQDFQVTEDILSHITEETELLMLCSPNNPTGQLISMELLEKILEKCRETGTWLMLDECFLGLSDGGESLLSRLREGDRVFLLHAFTKLYGMAGVRLGYALCKNQEFLDKICALGQPWNVSTVAQAAGLAALSCTEFVAATKALISEEKAYLLRELHRLGISVLLGRANYLMLSGVPGLYEFLLDRGILVRSCANYPGLNAGDIRIAVRTHPENQQLLAQLEEYTHARNRN